MPRLPINYNNTVMYKIVCNDLNIKDLYVGHTTDFIRRKKKHKSVCNLRSCDYKIYKTIRENGGWDNWSMIEIEKYPCNDGNEATSRERYWYENLNSTLNTLHPGRNMCENHAIYYLKNKDKILEKNKQYRNANKEKKSENLQKLFFCQCGATVKLCSKYDHLKTKKHFENLEKIQINI